MMDHESHLYMRIQGNFGCWRGGNSRPKKNCFYVENDLIRRLIVEVV